MKIMRALSTFIPAVVLLSLSYAIPPAAQADVIYTYTGNDFDSFFGSALNSSNFITASFTFASALPDDLDLADESGSLLNWTVSDQTNTLSQFGGNYLTLDLTTNESGEIANWSFFAETIAETSSGIPPNWLELASQNTGIVSDLSEFWVTDTDIAWIATVSSDPGTWAVTASTPEPSTIGWTCLLFGAMLLVAMQRQRQSR